MTIGIPSLNTAPGNNEPPKIAPAQRLIQYSAADLKEVHDFQKEGKDYYYAGRFWIVLAVPEALFITFLILSLTIDEFRGLQEDYIWAFVLLAVSLTTLFGWGVLVLHQFVYWDEDNFVWDYTNRQLDKREATVSGDNASLMEYAGLRKGRKRGGSGS